VLVSPRGIGGMVEDLRRYGVQAALRRLVSRRARLQSDLAEEVSTRGAGP